MKKSNNIIIQDWAGNILFKGHYKDPKVDNVLKVNRCFCYGVKYINRPPINCLTCANTGYSGDFEVYWDNDIDERNVYEFINY